MAIRTKLQSLALERNRALRDIAMMQSCFNHMQYHYPVSTVQASVFHNILVEQKQRVIDIYDQEKRIYNEAYQK